MAHRVPSSVAGSASPSSAPASPSPPSPSSAPSSPSSPASPARARVRTAIRLVEAAAGDADLGSVTPSAIAAAIRGARQALASDPGPTSREASRLLQEALESVEDGLPPDVTEAFLDRAARLLR